MDKLIPFDGHDVIGSLTAIHVSYPDSFSDRAKKVLRYLDDTAFLFFYKGKYVLTDESLYLTDYGDGSHDAPLGGPRYTCDTLEQLEAWLEWVADRYDEEDYPGWKKA